MQEAYEEDCEGGEIFDEASVAVETLMRFDSDRDLPRLPSDLSANSLQDWTDLFNSLSELQHKTLYPSGEENLSGEAGRKDDGGEKGRVVLKL